MTALKIQRHLALVNKYPVAPCRRSHERSVIANPEDSEDLGLNASMPRSAGCGRLWAVQHQLQAVTDRPLRLPPTIDQRPAAHALTPALFATCSPYLRARPPRVGDTCGNLVTTARCRARAGQGGGPAVQVEAHHEDQATLLTRRREQAPAPAMVSVSAHVPGRAFVLMAFLVLLGGVGGRPPECEWKLENEGVTAGGSEQVRTTCHVRTLSAALLTEGNGNGSLSALSHATHVTVLSLHCSRRVVFESEITAGMFAVFPRLEDLQILGCKVTDLPPRSLAGLPHLRRLTLRAHHQDWPGAALALHEDALADLNRLESLDLSYNALWSLPPSMLCGLPSLTALNLTHNRLHHLPDLGLGGSCSQSTDLDRESERSLPLHHLDLTYNQVAEVPKKAFHSARDLQSLSLKHNRLAHLADWAFGGLQTLRLLDLSHNRLVAVPRTALSDLHQLRELRLANNSLSVLSPAAFGSLGQLLTLDLSHNQLSLGASNAEPFTGLIRLVVLDVSHNRLVHLGPDTFHDLYSLQVLRLSHNQLSHLADATFASLANLHTLDLSQNQLGTLSGKALQGLSVLTHLSIDYNQLEVVHEASLDNCSSLHQLSMAHNQLQMLPEAVKRAPRLRTLDFSHNQIPSLEEGVLHGLVHLQELRLSDNALSNISRTAFTEVSSLILLDLSNNSISEIEYGAFDATPKLKGLDLHHNLLDGIKELHLHHNSISYVASNTFLDKMSVSLIDLRYNSLTLLEEAALRLSPRQSPAPLLLLSHNPLECDCGADWLLRAAGAGLSGPMTGGSILPHLGDVGSVQCRLPGLWHGAMVPLIVVQPQQFLCTYRRHCFTLCHCCDFDACDCEQTCPRNCTCYHDHTWTHNVVDCGGGAKDSTWVCGLMAPELEASGYRLCVAHRDCTAPSAPVAGRAIAESISCSRRIILVLSRGLVDAEWCRYDFKSATVDALSSVKHRHVVVVLLEDVPRSEMDPELAAITRTAGTTLHPRDPRFWEKLRRAMPSLRPRLRQGLAGTIGGKASSRPLVSAEHQNGPSWPLPETKTLGHTSAKSLIINPYWETAVGSNVSEAAWCSRNGPDLGAPPWVSSPSKQAPSTSPENEARLVGSPTGSTAEGQDHTYMSGQTEDQQEKRPRGVVGLPRLLYFAETPQTTSPAVGSSTHLPMSNLRPRARHTSYRVTCSYPNHPICTPTHSFIRPSLLSVTTHALPACPPIKLVLHLVHTPAAVGSLMPAHSSATVCNLASPTTRLLLLHTTSSR
ncbi:hypothetical protein C7M84_009531 [Penaeus vannamei]|uniref:TIR domain-containing protein n=1 Tax=Penaeus vannamei TaxID=6689 RepID=A0A3R7QMD7_PENVA|nr:hypothetical protein C7M84_009531 [Penaeus vannamei]